MLRYKTETRPGLVALYDIRPGNGAGPFLQPRSPHGRPKGIGGWVGLGIGKILTGEWTHCSAFTYKYYHGFRLIHWHQLCEHVKSRYKWQRRYRISTHKISQQFGHANLRANEPHSGFGQNCRHFFNSSVDPSQSLGVCAPLPMNIPELTVLVSMGLRHGWKGNYSVISQYHMLKNTETLEGHRH